MGRPAGFVGAVVPGNAHDLSHLCRQIVFPLKLSTVPFAGYSHRPGGWIQETSRRWLAQGLTPVPGGSSGIPRRGGW